LDIQTNFIQLVEAPDLSNVPPRYYEFIDVFSKAKAKVLVSYHFYNLQINLKEGAQPLASSIYSLLASEQETLKEFIKENLNIGFIQPISSLYGVLVLFIKKKDSLLYLCVNFHSFNYISKKNCYLLLFISDLLNLSHKVYIYTKIDLYYAYYLVCIANGDEWKTTFRKYFGLFE